MTNAVGKSVQVLGWLQIEEQRRAAGKGKEVARQREGEEGDEGKGEKGRDVRRPVEGQKGAVEEQRGGADGGERVAEA